MTEGGLADAGHVFYKKVAFGDQRDNGKLDDLVLAFDSAGYRVTERTDFGVHTLGG
jgi:hypothetical protein